MDIILLLIAAFVIVYHFGYSVVMVIAVISMEFWRDRIADRVEERRVDELARYGEAGAPKRPRLLTVFAALATVAIAVADASAATYAAAVLAVSHAVVWNVIALSGRVSTTRASSNLFGMASWVIAGMGLLSATIVPLIVMSSVATL